MVVLTFENCIRKTHLRISFATYVYELPAMCLHRHNSTNIFNVITISYKYHDFVLNENLWLFKASVSKALFS